MHDHVYQVNRISFLGTYEVINGIPRNPSGSTGMIGRNNLNFWGTNHSIKAIFTKYLNS